VQLLQQLRDEQAFASQSALMQQIQQDISAAKDVLAEL
jgi:FAD synthase